MPICPNCKSEVGAGAKFCMECGSPIPQNKVCPQCGTELPLAAKFCFGCGASLAGGNAPAAGLAMGDKNVVAGDVTGQKVMGNVVHNTIKDDTKSVNTCAVCGVHMTNDTGHTCPKCGKVVCAEHFDKKYLCCKACAEKDNTFTDPRDGQVYKTVKIGNQVWLAENFRYKCDGSYAYDDDNKNIKKYGRLYTWDAAMKCAPPGWHLPSREEWNNLQGYVEANANAEAGTALKSETGWEKWDGVPQGTDEFGFCALPAGYRNYIGDFRVLGKYAFFWSSTERFDIGAYHRNLGNLEDFVESWYGKANALSVRLLRD